MLLCVALVLSAKLHAQTPRFADAADDAVRVIELIDQRLALMPEVAAWKWHKQQPIADLEREHQVLARSVLEAQALGLNSESARRFFDVQIRMARAVQVKHFQAWQVAGAAPASMGRDLNLELRPLLDAIGRDLLTAVYLASADLPIALHDERVVARFDRLKRHGVSTTLSQELFGALATLRIDAAANLQSIQRVGVLRVGTTGDYAPFSNDSSGVLSGFDVDLAQALAQHWGVAIKFVRTTWPALLNDLNQHRFDIAMSGISVTPERTALSEFSSAYHIDGKTPIARCAQAKLFATLKNIDRSGVRVIVNPGGTNERFVRENIKCATIVIHADNRTVFDEIAANRADVMITDAIEVELQIRRHPKLCGTMLKPLTQTQKAIMLPHASDLATKVNAWLNPQISSGQIRRQLQTALRDAN